MSEVFDLTIIGGGPGGYVCAIRAAQLGMKVAVIEKRTTLGGTCVNVGCIPSKALLDTSHNYHKTKHELDVHGITTGEVKIDVKKMMERKTKVVKELTDGLNFLMKKNKITVFNGFGKFKSVAPENIVIDVEGEKNEVVTSKKCVIATGSEVIDLPGIETDGKNIISSDHAIALEKTPESMIIIGAGVIGLELGSVWSRLGTKVKIVEFLPGILPGLDRQIREVAARTYKKQGLEILLEHKVTGAKATAKKVKVTVENIKKGESTDLEAEKLLVAVGRRPFTDNLKLDAAGVELTERGRVKVDPHTLQTNVPGIYAIGDVIDGPMLAHKAEDEGVFVAELINGKPAHINYDAIPGIVYTWPEVAWVGKGEEELKEAGIAYNTGKFMIRPNGRAKAMNEPDGQIKVIADKRTDLVLGVAMVGPNASELIAEAAIAMEFGASAEDIARTCHAHPTISEAVKEAAMDVDKRSIHS